LPASSDTIGAGEWAELPRDSCVNGLDMSVWTDLIVRYHRCENSKKITCDCRLMQVKLPPCCTSCRLATNKWSDWTHWKITRFIVRPDSPLFGKFTFRLGWIERGCLEIVRLISDHWSIELLDAFLGNTRKAWINNCSETMKLIRANHFISSPSRSQNKLLFVDNPESNPKLLTDMGSPVWKRRSLQFRFMRRFDGDETNQENSFRSTNLEEYFR
jgi:hypothetical protein